MYSKSIYGILYGDSHVYKTLLRYTLHKGFKSYVGFKYIGLKSVWDVVHTYLFPLQSWASIINFDKRSSFDKVEKRLFDKCKSFIERPLDNIGSCARFYKQSMDNVQSPCREYWMDEAFTPSYDLAPFTPPSNPPPSPVYKLDRRHTGRLRKRNN